MPIFEYKCNKCSNKFEILHKSANNIEQVLCPECQSEDNKKLFSAFSASGSSRDNSCVSGSCGVEPSYGGCSSGMCGLN